MVKRKMLTYILDLLDSDSTRAFSFLENTKILYLPYFSFDVNMVSFFILQLRTSRTDIQDRQIKKEVCSLQATIDIENSVNQRNHN